jgi:hypothetical protein
VTYIATVKVSKEGRPVKRTETASDKVGEAAADDPTLSTELCE